MSYIREWGNRDEKSAEHGLVRGAGESIWEGVSAYVVLKGLLGAEKA